MHAFLCRRVPARSNNGQALTQLLEAMAPRSRGRKFFSQLSPTLPTELGPASLMIEGWSIPDESSAAAALWIRVGRSWQTAWR
jgi:hypothetical protein